jgi:hypothetical protein
MAIQTKDPYGLGFRSKAPTVEELRPDPASQIIKSSSDQFWDFLKLYAMQERADKTAAEGREFEKERDMSKVTDALKIMDKQDALDSKRREEERLIQDKKDKRVDVQAALDTSATLPNVRDRIRFLERKKSDPNIIGYTSSIDSRIETLKSELSFDDNKKRNVNDFYKLIGPRNIGTTTIEDITKVLSKKDELSEVAFHSIEAQNDYIKTFHSRKDVNDKAVRAASKYGAAESLEIAQQYSLSHDRIRILNDKIEDGQWTDPTSGQVIVYDESEVADFKLQLGRELQMAGQINYLIDQSMFSEEESTGANMLTSVLQSWAVRNNVAAEDITDAHKYDALRTYMANIIPERRYEVLKQLFPGADNQTLTIIMEKSNIPPPPSQGSRSTAPLQIYSPSFAGVEVPHVAKTPAQEKRSVEAKIRATDVSLPSGTRLHFQNKSWSVVGVKPGDEQKKNPTIVLKSDDDPPKTTKIPLSVLKTQARYLTTQ